MKARLFLAVVAAGLIFAVPAGLQAQSNIAVVDIAEVFKAHTRFNNSLDAMKQDVETFKNRIQAETQRLQAQSEQLNAYSASSAEYKELESQLTNDTAKLSVFRNQQNREFLEKEARLYFDTYVEISEALNQLTQERGITLVLRVDNKEPDPADSQTILQAVNRNIVYKRADRDITAMLIERVNR